MSQPGPPEAITMYYCETCGRFQENEVGRHYQVLMDLTQPGPQKQCPGKFEPVIYTRWATSSAQPGSSVEKESVAFSDDGYNFGEKRPSDLH